MTPELRAQIEQDMLECTDIEKDLGKTKTYYQRRKESGVTPKSVRIKADPDWDKQRRRILRKYGTPE